MQRIVIIIALLLGSYQLQAQELTRVLFIFDASNSMHGKWEGATKIIKSREILSKAILDLEGVPNLELALRVYGHQSPITPTFQDCNDTKLEIPFGKNTHGKIVEFINFVDPKGTTPIARSLEAAADDFPDKKARNVIILITDGLEACDGFPCEVAKKLKDKGVNVTPFVVGLGIDLSYLNDFSCIGRYYEATTVDAFEKVMQSILSDVIMNTTAQIDLQNTSHKAKETNTTVFLYEAGTKNLKHTFMHTMNRYGNPDTLTVISPDLTYDMVVNTLPKVTVKNVKVYKGTHTHLKAYCPQGALSFKIKGPTKKMDVKCVVRQAGKMQTLNVQNLGDLQKYLVGNYDIEVLTLPRIYINNLEVKQSKNSYNYILGSGLLKIKSYKAIVGQIFVKTETGEFEWVCDFDDRTLNQVFYLQPGEYKMVSRNKSAISTDYTNVKPFSIIAGEILSITL